jgi:hypothetical protein
MAQLGNAWFLGSSNAVHRDKLKGVSPTCLFYQVMKTALAADGCCASAVLRVLLRLRQFYHGTVSASLRMHCCLA